MKKRTSIILIIGFVLIILGGIFALSGFYSGGSTTIYLTDKGVKLPHEIDVKPYTTKLPDFTKVAIDADARSSVKIVKGTEFKYEYRPGSTSKTVPGDNGAAKFDPKEFCTVEDGVLKVKYDSFTFSRDAKGPFGNVIHLGLSPQMFTEDEIIITVPDKTKLTSVTSENDSGSLTIDSIDVDSMTTQTGFGSLYVSNSSLTGLRIENSYGSVHLDKVRVAGEVSVELSSGDFTMEDSEAASLDIDNSSGEIYITSSKVTEKTKLMSGYGTISVEECEMKDVSATNSSGDILMSGAFYGTADIEDSYGQVTFQTKLPKDQYKVDLQAGFGEIVVDGDTISEDDGHVRLGSDTAANSVSITNDSGQIDVSFSGYNQ